VVAVPSVPASWIQHSTRDAGSLPALWPAKVCRRGRGGFQYGRFKLNDDAAEGRRLIGRARDIFVRIGAVGWVADADAAPESH
jgi:hypothetical protein